MLCDHPEGWDREGGREGDARGKRYGDICIADSLCYKAETNTPYSLWCIQSDYTPIKMLKKKSEAQLWERRRAKVEEMTCWPGKVRSPRAL